MVDSRVVQAQVLAETAYSCYFACKLKPAIGSVVLFVFLARAVRLARAQRDDERLPLPLSSSLKRIRLAAGMAVSLISSACSLNPTFLVYSQ